MLHPLVACRWILGGCLASSLVVGHLTLAGPTERTYRVSTYGVLHLLVPEEWEEVAVSTTPQDLVVFSLPERDGPVRVSIAPPFRAGESYTLERLQSGTTIARAGLKKEAKNGEIPMRTLSGRGNRGFCLSYARSQPDEYGRLFRAQCAVVLEGMALNVVTHYRHENENLLDDIAEVARTATLEPLRSYKLQLPGATWAAIINVEGFTIDSASDETHVLGFDEKTGVTFSAFLEPGRADATSQRCREIYTKKLQRSPLAMESPFDGLYREMALHEYMIIRAAGRTVRQKNIHAHLAHDGTCIEVHVSKTRFKEKHRAMLTSVLDGVSVVPADSTGT